MAKIQPQSVGLEPELPRHIGIIMDGNGRYATRQGLPRKLGHRSFCGQEWNGCGGLYVFHRI